MCACTNIFSSSPYARLSSTPSPPCMTNCVFAYDADRSHACLLISYYIIFLDNPCLRGNTPYVHGSTIYMLLQEENTAIKLPSPTARMYVSIGNIGLPSRPFNEKYASYNRKKLTVDFVFGLLIFRQLFFVLGQGEDNM